MQNPCLAGLFESLEGRPSTNPGGISRLASLQVYEDLNPCERQVGFEKLTEPSTVTAHEVHADLVAGFRVARHAWSIGKEEAKPSTGRGLKE